MGVAILVYDYFEDIVHNIDKLDQSMHHQWQPDELLLEQPLYRDLHAAMQQRGHVVKAATSLAASQAIRWTPAGIEAGSDPRKHGQPRGW